MFLISQIPQLKIWLKLQEDDDTAQVAGLKEDDRYKITFQRLTTKLKKIKTCKFCYDNAIWELDK